MRNRSALPLYFLLIAAPSLQAGTGDPSWRNAARAALYCGGMIGCLQIAKKITGHRNITSAINNRLAYPVHQRLYEDDVLQDEMMTREQHRAYVESSLYALINRTQKRLAIMGILVVVSMASGNVWWHSFTNNALWMQARISLGTTFLYYVHPNQALVGYLFESPMREALWMSSALIYTQYSDTYRHKDLLDVHDFPEWVLGVLSFLYEMGRVDN
ncbi:MAG: hypothetical protein WD449_01925 [Candidatus Babeliales bacterium]